jgi:hypothetical protein
MGRRGNNPLDISCTKVLLCLFLLLLLTTKNAPGETYVEISAEIELAQQASDMAEQLASGRKFGANVIVGTNEWFITSNYMRGGEEKWRYDGTNIYHSIRPIEPGLNPAGKVGGKSPFAIVPFEKARSNLTINVWNTVGGAPLGHTGVNTPWLVFCSGPYLKRAGRVIPIPIEMLRHAPDAFGYSDKTETFDDPLGLPRKVHLFTSRELFEKSVLSETFMGKRDVELWRPAINRFPDGELKFNYGVITATNFLGWNFPVRFEFSQRGPDEEGNLSPRFSGRGVVTAISSSTNLPHVFDLAYQQTIVDWRFRDPTLGLDALTYKWTNIFLVPTNHPFLLEKLRRKLDRPTK